MSSSTLSNPTAPQADSSGQAPHTEIERLLGEAEMSLLAALALARRVNAPIVAPLRIVVESAARVHQYAHEAERDELAARAAQEQGRDSSPRESLPATPNGEPSVQLEGWDIRDGDTVWVAEVSDWVVVDALTTDRGVVTFDVNGRRLGFHGDAHVRVLP